MSNGAAKIVTESKLDNIVWHSLAGTQARLARGTAAARRLGPGFPLLLGFADRLRPDFAGLDAYCEPGEHFYCFGWPGPVAPGWQVDAEAAGLQMVWSGPPSPRFEPFPCVWLTPEHVPQMRALAAATQPGPFGERNIELGEYAGVFEDGRLIAMAGQRLAAGPLREISAVCTLPQFRGRGLGRRLVESLLDLQLRRRQTPFLHVMSDNSGARRLYEQMGFHTRMELLFRVVSRAP
jgi:ribosomal protein S18 acetylase RimI-like enzyme